MTNHTQKPAESRRNPTDLTLLQHAQNDLRKIIQLAGELQAEFYQTGNCNPAYVGLSRLSRLALDIDERLFELRSSCMEGSQ